MKERERRFKRVCVSPEAVLHLFQVPTWDGVGYLSFAGIPKDAEILDVHYAPENREFGFLVSHPSFDVVPDGEMVPRVPGQMSAWWRVEGYEAAPDAVVG